VVLAVWEKKKPQALPVADQENLEKLAVLTSRKRIAKSCVSDN
jgi:hypothetical protein